MTNRILFVCLGNICRSPTAEAVFRQLADEAGAPVEVDGAGTSDWHVGDAPYGPMIKAGAARGYDLSPLRARQVSAADFDEFDLILAMDAKNLSHLQAMAPTGARARVALFLEEAGLVADEGTDVPDPYYTRDFDGALDLVEQASRALLAQLQ